MNSHFKSALNRIKADEALISKTEVYLRDTLAKGQNSRITKLEKWSMINMKKFAMAACVAVLLIGGGFKVYATPLSYVSLDINPSVELGVNTVGQVVTAEGYNEDGKTVLNGIKATGMNVTKAVSTIVDSAAHKGFIANDGSTVVSVTTETDNNSTAAKLKAEAEAGANKALTENGKSADVRNDNVALTRRDDARALGITPGKLNLIEKLQAVDETATVDQYKDAPVKDIMKAIQAKTDNSAISNKDNGSIDNKDKDAVTNKDNGAVKNKDDGAVSNTNEGTVNSTNKGAENSNSNTNRNSAVGNNSTNNGNK
ncbi:MAG TPA: hypothetical protein VN374_00645 [Desulfitobacteriaceae bacterium]|nr:hypothetical protein [Desulfitobacteriaceae bacterium]